MKKKIIIKKFFFPHPVSSKKFLGFFFFIKKKKYPPPCVVFNKKNFFLKKNLGNLHFLQGRFLFFFLLSKNTLTHMSCHFQWLKEYHTAVFTNSGALLRAQNYMAEQASESNEEIRVFAQDISDNMCKCYVVGTLRNIFRLFKDSDKNNRYPMFRGRHFYEIIPENWRCKLYFDLEYKNEDNPDVKGEELLQIMKHALTLFIEADGFSNTSFELLFGELPEIDFLVLDSSDEKKTSYHLLVDIYTQKDGNRTSVQFQNNYHVGDFVANFLLYCSDSSDYHELFIKDPAYKNSTQRRFIADMVVYKKNQCLRTIFSSKKKVGKVRTLYPQDQRDKDITFESFTKYLVMYDGDENGMVETLTYNYKSLDDNYKPSGTVKDYCKDPRFVLGKRYDPEEQLTLIKSVTGAPRVYSTTSSIEFFFHDLLKNVSFENFMVNTLRLDIMKIQMFSPRSIRITSSTLECPQIRQSQNRCHRDKGKTYIDFNLLDATYKRKCWSVHCTKDAPKHVFPEQLLNELMVYFESRINDNSLRDYFTAAIDVFSPPSNNEKFQAPLPINDLDQLHMIVDIIGPCEKTFEFFTKKIPQLFKSNTFIVSMFHLNREEVHTFFDSVENKTPITTLTTREDFVGVKKKFEQVNEFLKKRRYSEEAIEQIVTTKLRNHHATIKDKDRPAKLNNLFKYIQAVV